MLSSAESLVKNVQKVTKYDIMQKQLNRKTYLKRNLTKSKARRPVKQNMNISRAETLNEATKHL